MPRIKRTLHVLLGSLLLVSHAGADEIGIGLITEMSGLYAGQGSRVAAELAVDDFGGEVLGRDIKLYLRDHQLDAELAVEHAEELIQDKGVTLLTDLVRSHVALAVQDYASDQGVITMAAGAGATELTGEQCTRLGFNWAFNVDALAQGVAGAITRSGGESWYFLTADYAFGHSLERAATEVIEANGGERLGHSTYSFDATDLSVQVLDAQASGADVIGLASGGKDTIKAIRQVHELGGSGVDQQLAAMLLFITDIKQMGLYITGGLQLVTTFYWDGNPEARAFAERFRRRTGTVPSMIHAGVYSATLQYLKAVEAVGSTDAEQVAEQLHSMPVDDFFGLGSRVRPNGLHEHPVYLVQVKNARDSEGPWDYFEVLERIPTDVAFPPIEDSACHLVDAR